MAFTLVPLSSATADPRLIEAVKKQDATAIRALIGRVDVNARQGDGATALHWAAYLDDVGTADQLIRAGASVNVRNDLGASPLWLAAGNRTGAMVERLLVAGADPNTTLRSGETPLMMAARVGNVRAIELLLINGADVNAREASNQQTALMWAVGQRHPGATAALLKYGADVNARSSVRHQLENTARNLPGGVVEIARGSFTALLFAARSGDVDSARLLLTAGANVDDTAADGSSALVIAAHSGRRDLAKLLIDNRADPNAAGAGYTALHAAVMRGDLALVERLLAAGANANTPLARGMPARRFEQDLTLDKSMVGATPLWVAARFGEPAIMNALASRGADPQRNTAGISPLLAAMQGAGERLIGRPGGGIMSKDPEREEGVALEIARLSVTLGININTADANGNTALHAAASNGFASVVAFLVEHGAELNARNKKAQTPLALTAARAENRVVGRDVLNVGRPKTAELLRALGGVE